MDIKLSFRRMLQAGASMSVFLGVLAGAGQAAAEPTELKVGFYQNETHIFIQVARKILPELEKKTEGRYRFGIYPSEVLGKAMEQMDLTNRSLVFANLICPCYYPGTFPLFNIETVPIWSGGGKGVKAAFDGGLNKLYEDYLHSRGMKNVGFLGATAFTTRSLGMTKVEVHSPSDFKGKKIRTLGLERVLPQVNGGAVITLPMPGVYEALQRNMISGLMAQESNWMDWKLYEVLDNIAFLDLTTSPMSMIYSISELNKIPEVDRKIVLEVLNNYKETLSADFFKEVEDARTFLTTKWKGHAYYPTPEEKQAFKKSAESETVKLFLEKAGDLGPKALEIVKKYNP